MADSKNNKPGLDDLVLTVGADISPLEDALNQIPVAAAQATAQIQAAFDAIPAISDALHAAQHVKVTLPDVGLRSKPGKSEPPASLTPEQLKSSHRVCEGCGYVCDPGNEVCPKCRTRLGERSVPPGYKDPVSEKIRRAIEGETQLGLSPAVLYASQAVSRKTWWLEEQYLLETGNRLTITTTPKHMFHSYANAPTPADRIEAKKWAKDALGKAVKAGIVPAQHPRRRQPLRKATSTAPDELEQVKILASNINAELKAEDFRGRYREICRRLGDMARPVDTEWAHLTWPEAYKKSRGSVDKWLSKHLKA